jgi:hypothetical protein
MLGVGNTFDNSSARSGRGGSSRFSPALEAGGGGGGGGCRLYPTKGVKGGL